MSLSLLSKQIKDCTSSWWIQTASTLSHFPKLSLLLYHCSDCCYSELISFLFTFFQHFSPLFILSSCCMDSKPMKITKNCTQICMNSCVDSIKACSSSPLACWCLQGLWCTQPLHTVVIIMHIYRSIQSSSVIWCWTPQKHTTSHLFIKCVYENKKERLAGLKYQRVFWAPHSQRLAAFCYPLCLGFIKHRKLALKCSISSLRFNGSVIKVSKVISHRTRLILCDGETKVKYVKFVKCQSEL